jgi:hypothetical protein
MRRYLLVLVLVSVGVTAAFAQSAGAAPVGSAGGFALYANVGSGWYGGSDWESWITSNLSTNSTLKTSNAIAYAVGFLDRIGGNPLYLEVGMGIAGFTGGWDTNLETFAVSYFTIPIEMSLGLRFPVGKLFLMAQAGLAMKLQLSADWTRTGPLASSGSLESDWDYSLLAYTVPIAAGLEIPVSRSMLIDILAIYEIGLGLDNYLGTWGDLTENQFAVRFSIVFPFAPRGASGSASQPSTGVQR